MITKGALPPDKPLAWQLDVLVAMPAHVQLGSVLSYASEQALAAGSLVRVPLGAREVLGVVCESHESRADVQDSGVTLKPIVAALDGIAPLSAAWRALLEFAARYYQRSAGELALAALPPQLRQLDAQALSKRMAKKPKATQLPAQAPVARQEIALSEEQDAALSAFFGVQEQTSTAKPALLPALLFGSTGSGKTEVYLRAIERVLATEPQAQVLILVPEINLTPQLQAIVEARLGAIASYVTLHSGITPAQRLKSWLTAHSGQARIVLATRMGVFASMPHLRLIVVDEEHDASYRSQDGARHSARDLAVMRAKIETEHQLPEGAATAQPCRVLLASATPSIESWQAAQSGRYQLLRMDKRIGDAKLPKLHLADLRREPRGTAFSKPLLEALKSCIARGEQALVFLNRRGYSPVLACDACGWKCACPHCSAYRVFHKTDRMLRCHHCGHTERVPRACPECGNIDIAPLGRGTQKVEEQLAVALGDSTLNILRIDADTTRHKGALEQQLAQVHTGQVHILVGTQMVTKGHDFRRIGLVAALDADAALFSNDFRAPERLFALLMQAAGRAGRDAQLGSTQMWVQSRYPDHPLFKYLARHDYVGFATQELSARSTAMLPPFSYQALLRAEARSQEAAQAFLASAQEAAQALLPESVTVYPPLPMSLQRVADVERAQMLIEGHLRPELQRFLASWLQALRQSKPKGLIRFALDVDPILI
jgi:primosomal protein N' (replication factor Y) (superfamily II helicase)